MVFAAISAVAGDNSSSDGAPGANVDLPSACPHFVGCGGTTRQRFSEVVWGDGRPDGRGTGGDIRYICRTALANRRSPRTTPGPGGRMVPDVAGKCQPEHGTVVVNGTETQMAAPARWHRFMQGCLLPSAKNLAGLRPRYWLILGHLSTSPRDRNGSYFAGRGTRSVHGLGVPNGARRRLFLVFRSTRAI